jgi:hypothetical protein
MPARRGGDPRLFFNEFLERNTGDCSHFARRHPIGRQRVYYLK